MQRGHHGDTFPFVPFPSLLSEGESSAKEQAAGLTAERENDVGLYGFDLLSKEGSAGCEFFARTGTVIRWSALQDGRDVDFVFREGHGVEHVAQKLAGLVTKYAPTFIVLA